MRDKAKWQLSITDSKNSILMIHSNLADFETFKRNTRDTTTTIIKRQCQKTIGGLYEVEIKSKYLQMGLLQDVRATLSLLAIINHL